MIVALAGRRIDAVDAEERHFPLEMKKTVYEKIMEFFHRNNVKILVSSAACGADLLAQKAAGELEIEQHIILPFNRKKFRKTSVTDRPGDWGKLFDEICDKVEKKGNLLTLGGFEKDEKAYSAVTEELLNRAKNLQKKDEEILAIIIWEGMAKNKNDETNSFAEKAKTQNFQVAEILTS